MVGWLTDRMKKATRAAVSLVYVTILVAAPIADTALEAQSINHETHVEQQSSEQCAPGHDDFLCHLCRLIELQPERGVRQRLEASEAAHHRDQIREIAAPHQTTASSPQNPRAPPAS